MAVQSFARIAGRRGFLLRGLPGGMFLCLGCSRLSALAAVQEKSVSVEKKHKFLEDSEMSFQDVFAFTFKHYYIPMLQSVAPYFKGGDFIDVLKRAVDDLVMKEEQDEAKKRAKNDFAAFRAEARKSDRFWDHVFTLNIVEDTDKAMEFRVTECLWAKTFREAGAEDIGFATICYPDFASARAFNPQIKLIRTKTLMQGDDHCDHRWIWEG
jgi:hypothetical protein